ncbi:MAG: hypothetical protein HY287_12675 [Planctomycetes bacterium]|nr:hypothetical protein [Planctomycetota bacterium]MBI3835177.1 hypothetical protein [Planctomycetota bacterium]
MSHSFLLISLAGCASWHAHNVQSGLQGDRLTLGAVQRDIHKGMTNADVVESLGSPNIITTDESGNENWVYDKFATDVVHSSSGWSIFGIGAGVTGGTAIGAGGTGTGSAGAASTSQRTLTVIVKFDENHRVRDFAYRTSRF